MQDFFGKVYYTNRSSSSRQEEVIKMAKKKKRLPKTGPIKIDAMDVWQAQKPRFNGYACGHGTHGDTKYNRNKEKRA